MLRSLAFLVGAAFAAVPIFVSADTVTMPPAGSYTYVSTMATSQGKSTITVGHDGVNVQVIESSTGTIGTVEASATATQTLGPDLSPISYTATYSGGGVTKSSNLALNAAQASGSMPNGQSTFTLTSGSTHFVILDGALLSGFFTLPAQMNVWQRAQTDLIAPIYDQSARLMLDNGPPPDRPATVPANDVPLSFSAPLAFTIWYDPATLLMDELDVPSQGIIVTRVR